MHRWLRYSSLVLVACDLYTQGAQDSDAGVTAKRDATVDGARDVSTDVARDAPKAVPAVRCGASTCDPKLGEACCWTFQDGAVSRECVTNGSCESGALFGCDSADDCHQGEVCCGELSNKFVSGSRCDSTCGPTEPRLCDPAVGECSCSGAYGPFHVCK